MNGIPDCDQISGLQAVLNEFYEVELQRDRDRRDWNTERLAGLLREEKERLRASGLDFERMDEKDKERAAYDLKQLRERERASLVERPTTRAQFYKERSLRTSVVSQTNTVLMSPYMGTLRVPDRSFLAGIEGKIGNPSISPYNPEEINMKLEDEGDDWGWPGGWLHPYAEYDLWYTFIPDRTASWVIRPMLAIHGFYIVRADDGYTSSREALVYLKVKIDVHQYYWHGEHEFTVIDERGSNIDVVGQHDITHGYQIHADLKAGDCAAVLVQIQMGAGAKGWGSYAEINFNDGSANYILPDYCYANAV